MPTIKTCTCGHPDGRHVVNPEDEEVPTNPGKGTCYDCRCQSFTERMQLVQLVSHRPTGQVRNVAGHRVHDDRALLLGLDTYGRVWFWDGGEDVWKQWGDTFQFTSGE